MAVPFDRHALRVLLRDHARWAFLVMAAGLVPLGLGAVLLVREAAIQSQATQDARLQTAASSEVAALTQSLGRSSRRRP
ncbi:MAG TPA: hypothetical protein VLB81_05095 [Gaiellales bacterium]|nr:hypothetical protein [Gaiellales bacterium]